MKKECTVFVGENPIEVGKLSYEKKGQKSTSAFLYSDSWLRNPDQFALSPDLPLISGYQFHSARTSDESAFFACFSDVEPDGWGKMVIQRDFAKQRKDGVSNDRTALLDNFDYLIWISDFSRIGAIRFRKVFFSGEPISKGRYRPLLNYLNYYAQAKQLKKIRKH
ncbi:MAG: hypothetical protein RJA18_1269 [Pseudomonadota bacterium]